MTIKHHFYHWDLNSRISTIDKEAGRIRILLFLLHYSKNHCCGFLDVYPGSKNCSTGSFLTQKTCLYDIEEKKLIYDVHSGPQIRIFFSFRIPDQGVKKHRIRVPDPVGPKKADPTDQDPEHL